MKALTTEQLGKFLEVAHPMMDWLAKNCEPNAEIRVTASSVEILEVWLKNVQLNGRSIEGALGYHQGE